MKGTMRITCKDHEHLEREIFSALPAAGVKRLRISEHPVNGSCRFGVAITPSSCYELSLMEPEKRTKLLKEIYAKEGLGLSIARICIGSSDYAPELYSYDDVPFDTELKHFSVKRDEVYIIPMIQEILAINPDLFLFASPWSPPFWMKTGESMCGGYMRRQYLDCYGDYFVKFLQAYADYGIHISAVTPQNEPETQQSGTMPACVWHPEIEAEFISILKAKLKANGMDTEIWMYDHNFNGVDRVIWSLEQFPDLRDACQAAAFHYYEGTIEQTLALKERYPHVSLHFTEGGPRLCDHYDTDWCKWGIMMIKALQCGYESFTGWNLMLDELGGPNVGPFLGQCGGLVTRDSQTGEIRYSGQLKAFSHITPYVKPTSEIYSITEENRLDRYLMSAYPVMRQPIEGVWIDNGADGKTAVLVNPNEVGVQVQLETDGTLWYVELQADSLSTITFESL